MSTPLPSTGEGMPHCERASSTVQVNGNFGTLIPDMAQQA